MKSTELSTSSHALLSVFETAGIDRVFLVPGESYLGILDALADFPGIDVVTCRHESGAGFMACADGRLTRRPGVVMVSRGPGATNASIAVHAAQQDGIPLILVVGQVPAADLRKEAFQEIDYQQMYRSIAKWVVEVTDAQQLAVAAFKAVRIAVEGTPGPVVLVVPEDIQQQAVPQPEWAVTRRLPAQPAQSLVDRVADALSTARKPLIIAGGEFDQEGGREALLGLAEEFNIPVALSFRRHDIFPNGHRLFVGDLGLVNPSEQIDAFSSSDLILALGTRLGDITTQGYRFPALPKASQTLVHVHSDARNIGLHFSPDIGIACDVVAFSQQLAQRGEALDKYPHDDWTEELKEIHQRIAKWPTLQTSDGVPFVSVVRCLAEVLPKDGVVCLDAGTFAAPVYRHFEFAYPQRMMASLSGAMGYGAPAAVATQLRFPHRKVVCLVGDGGFLMTGNEMMAAVERNLPILFVLSNNNCFGSIRVHQEREYPRREHRGTTLVNPDFIALARSFGVEAELVNEVGEIDAALDRGLAANRPYFVEVRSSLDAILPNRNDTLSSRDRSGD